MDPIISTPTRAYAKNHTESVSGANLKHRFGYFETQNSLWRLQQEDALAWHTLTLPELTPKEIGHRLWTSYQLLNDPEAIAGDDGTTASTTVYDGKGNLITATLADAVSFAAIYDKEGKVLGVVRLNSVTHKPANPDEKVRIEAAGGRVELYGCYRVDGVLAVSRAIGDRTFGDKVPADAHIDITSVDKILKDKGIKPEDVGSIQIITTCDGFTDGAGEAHQTKEDHETYLFNSLKQMKAPAKKAEKELAEQLARVAIASGSKDNVSVAIQTIIPNKTGAFLLGVYDGHGGDKASIHAAKNIGRVFNHQCGLDYKAYVEQEFSVLKQKAIYARDNQGIEDAFVKDAGAISAKLVALTQDYQRMSTKKGGDSDELNEILVHLLGILNNKDKLPQDNINAYYTFLNAPSKGNKALKNIDVIKKDPSSANFLLGIALIAATALTGIIIGAVIFSIVYAVSGKHPFNFLKTHGGILEEKVGVVEAEHQLASAFFKPAPAVPKNEGPEAGMSSQPGVS